MSHLSGPASSAPEPTHRPEEQFIQQTVKPTSDDELTEPDLGGVHIRVADAKQHLPVEGYPAPTEPTETT